MSDYNKWMLPSREGKRINKNIIQYNAKYHYFIIADGITSELISLCEDHTSRLENINSVDDNFITLNPDAACKRCFNKWLKLQKRD